MCMNVTTIFNDENMIRDGRLFTSSHEARRTLQRSLTSEAITVIRDLTERISDIRLLHVIPLTTAVMEQTVNPRIKINRFKLITLMKTVKIQTMEN